MTRPRDEDSGQPGSGTADCRSADSGSADSAPQRREIFYSGDVQGVGFRYTARSIAASLPVVGWVRNLPDGRVQLVAEGTRAALDDLVSRLQEEMGRHIRGRQVTVGRATGEFSSFDVVR